MYYRQLGVDLVVPDKVDKGGYFQSLSWENADAYRADLIMLDDRTGTLQPNDLASKPTWSRLPAVRAGQVIPWSSEPRFSYAGAAPLLEALAKAVQNAKKVG
jgi:iron complex transport system substrate-binding protein